MKGYHGVFATVAPLPIDGDRLWHDYGVRLLSCVSVPRHDGSSGPYALTLTAPANFDLSSLYVSNAITDYYKSLGANVSSTHCVNVGHWFEDVA